MVLLLVARLGRGGRVQGLEVHDLHVVREALRVKVMGISLNWQSLDILISRPRSFN